MSNKFWRFAKNEAGNNTLRIDGIMAEESWWEDEISPKQFREELNKCNGDLTIFLNSPGGDVFAASEIYSALMEYKGNITIKIDRLAASAASMIAMAGGEVCMSPTSYMMIHNPVTFAWGSANEMQQAKDFLEEIKEGIITAYELKTNKSREEISDLMNVETWMNAKKAVELGFADKILYVGDKDEPTASAMMFSPLKVTNSLISKLQHKKSTSNRVSADMLRKKLNLLTH